MRLNVVPHVRDFSSGRFPRDNLTKILHASLVYLTLATRSAHCSHLDFTKNPYNLTPMLKLRKVFQVGGIPLGVSPQLLIRYIRSYTSYLQAVSSVRNPRACRVSDKVYI
jgi:hypothetical protein